MQKLLMDEERERKVRNDVDGWMHCRGGICVDIVSRDGSNPCPDGHEARAITLLPLPREVLGAWCFVLGDW